MVPSLIVHTTLDTFYLIALNALFFKICINHITQKFPRLLHSHEILL